jgi:hypothetical protein
MRSRIQAGSTIPQAAGRLGVRGFDAVALEFDEGVGILREAARNGRRQRQMVRCLDQHRLGQLEVKSTGVARQPDIVFCRAALRRQLIGHPPQKQRLRRAAGQRYQSCKRARRARGKQCYRRPRYFQLQIITIAITGNVRMLDETEVTQ